MSLQPPSEPSKYDVMMLIKMKTGEVDDDHDNNNRELAAAIKNESKISGSTVPIQATTTTSTCLTTYLPEEMLCKITSFLGPPSLLTLGLCNHHLHDLTRRNEAGWEGLCEQLWASKLHAPDYTAICQKNNIEHDDGTNLQSSSHFDFQRAFRMSILDAKMRHHLTQDELCFDPNTHTGTVWCFRFKESAGTHWTMFDPWYAGESCRKMVFLKDGSIKQYAPPQTDVMVETQHNRQEQPTKERIPPGGTLSDSSFVMSWRFLTQPAGWPKRVLGSYVRISVDGREVPTYTVRRSPTNNWGFLMESCWGLFASFQLPPRCVQQPAASTDGHNNRHSIIDQPSPPPPGEEEPQNCLRRTDVGVHSVEVDENGEETLDNHHGDEGSMQSMTASCGTSNPELSLADDSNLIITNEMQWREAFLYNMGARALPEGED